MDVILCNGEERTWTPDRGRIAECTSCGSRSFRWSKLNRRYYCKDCNEDYGNEKPWFPSIRCSTHGRQIQQNNGEDTYWCTDCEEEAFKHAYPSTRDTLHNT